MTDLLRPRIEQYRTETFRYLPEDRVQTKAEAVDFINQRGFLLFHPAKEIDFPSLWAARAGDRPVPNEHDDPGHITWQWKDELLGEKQCYYGRLLGQKMTFVSLEMLPYFFRLSKNLEYENDYLYIYQKGELSYEAKQVYEVLLDEGPMDTLLLRKKTGMWGKENQYRYTKTLNQLQTALMILPVGVAAVGRWNYAFIYDIVPRYFADLQERSTSIRRKEAQEKILYSLVKSLGATDKQNIRRLLRWPPMDLTSAIMRLEEKEIIASEIQVDGFTAPQVVLRELLI